MHKFVLFTIATAVLLQAGCAMQRGTLSQTSRPEILKGRQVASVNLRGSAKQILRESNFCRVSIYQGAPAHPSTSVDIAYACSGKYNNGNQSSMEVLTHSSWRNNDPTFHPLDVAGDAIKGVISQGMVLANCYDGEEKSFLVATGLVSSTTGVQRKSVMIPNRITCFFYRPQR